MSDKESSDGSQGSGEGRRQERVKEERVEGEAQGGEQELATKMLQIQSKRFYLDVKENKRGKFIKVAEISADGRRSQIFLALSTAAEFRDQLSAFSDFYSSLGPPSQDTAPEDGKLKSEMMIKDNRRYYLDLKENPRGRFLRVSQTITRGGPRSQIAIPAQGMIEFRSEAFTEKALKLESEELMHFLERSTETPYGEQYGSETTHAVVPSREGKAMPAWDHWLPGCMAHTKRVVRRVDLSYTDIQLESLLENECWMEQSFPNTYEDGYDHKKACKKFAGDLVCARNQELKSGSCEGYEDFCQSYYLHKGGCIGECEKEKKAEEVKAEPKEISGWKSTAPMLILLLIIVVAGLSLLYMRSKRGPA